MEEQRFELDFLSDKTNYYLSEALGIREWEAPKIQPEQLLREVALYRIDEISFEDKAPRKEALENVLSAMRIEGINFLYLILGNEEGVRFYYGVSRDVTREQDMELNIYDIGKCILEPSIRGNFRGSRSRQVEPGEKKKLVETIANMKYYSMLEGVPGYTKEDEKFQGADRLVDVMLGDTFGFLILASAASYEEMKQIEDHLYETYTRLTPLAKQSFQKSESVNRGTTEGITTGTSATTGESWSENTQISASKTSATNTSTSFGSNTSTTTGTSTSSGGSSSSSSTSKSGQEGTNKGKSEGSSVSEGTTKGSSSGTGGSASQGSSESVSRQTSDGSGESGSISFEYIDKKAQDWIGYLDDVIIPRLDYGMGKGIFLTAAFLFSTNKAQLKKLENTAISLYSGEKGNKVPLRAVPLEHQSRKLAMLKQFQLPCADALQEMSRRERVARSALSQFVGEGRRFLLGNWITTNELAMIAGLPQKDVAGLALREEVEFGLNVAEEIEKESRIALGNMVQSGSLIKKEVFLDKRNLDKHLFITGVTGSGKTTTCHKILMDSDLPFLVIEPAKTEYRMLAHEWEDLLIFTLGKDTAAPFRLNPFEFFPHESITSRADMILASIEASFDMEAAIPQLIETAIYRCYEDCGWNIASNQNRIYGESAFDDGVSAFPTLRDLVDKVEQVVKDQGFDERLKNDYIGSIRARLQGLLAGAKGLMFNTRRSIDFEALLSRRVVLEMEEIRSGAEKSLMMGFILTNLVEAVKAKFLKEGAGQHITLVEEAHRLLSRYLPGDSPNKKHGVETFSDMLAEIRKYGECLMIVDQIPDKLTPEVLKNTNTKIVHRLFAEDDKNAVGNTMALSPEQKGFLSNLENGRAIVFTQGFHKAIQVQINSRTDTAGRAQTSEETIRKRAMDFYRENYQRAVFAGSQLWEAAPGAEEMEMLIRLSREEALKDIPRKFCERPVCDDQSRALLRECLKECSPDVLGKYMALIHFSQSPNMADKKKAKDPDMWERMAGFVRQYAQETMTGEARIRYKNQLLLGRGGKESWDFSVR